MRSTPGVSPAGSLFSGGSSPVRMEKPPPQPHKKEQAMQINKVSIKSEKIHLEYSKRIPKASGEFLVDDYSMTCSEPALHGFYDTLHSLRAHVCEICELPVEYEEGMKVIGVSFTYDDEN